MSGHPLSLHNIFGLPGDCTEDCNADIVALCEGYMSFPEEPVPPPYPMPAVPLLEDTGFDQNRIDALFKLELNPDSPLYGCGETTNVALPSGASDPDRIPLDTLLDAMALPPRPAALPPRPAAPPPRIAAPRPATPPPRPAASPPRPIAPPPRPALTPMPIGTALAGFNASDPMAIVRLSKRKAVVLGEGVDERSSRYAQPSPTMSSLRAQAAAGPSRVPLSHQPTPQELAAVEQPQEDLEGEVAADLADERPRPAKRARKPRKGCATDEKIQKAVYIAPGRSVTMQCPCCPHVFSLDDIQQAWEHWDTKHAASTDGEEAKYLAVGTSISAGTSSPEEGADPARRENHGKEKEKKQKQKAYGQCPWPECKFNKRTSTEHQRHFRDAHLRILFLCRKCNVGHDRWDLLRKHQNSATACATNKLAKLRKNEEDSNAGRLNRDIKDVEYVISSKELEKYRKRGS